MKFTFKTEDNGAWYDPEHHVKLKRKKVGYIEHQHPHKIRLSVIKTDLNEDGNPNCQWKWISLKEKFESVAEAKVWLNENIDSILAKYDLHKF